MGDMAFPIIGEDFLANFKMVVKLSSMQLLAPAGLEIPLEQGFGAGAARSQGIWLEPEPSLWPAPAPP